MHATPAKLPDDTWGVRVYDPAHAGDFTGQPVTVESKGGKSWTSVLTEIVSFDSIKGVALYRKAEKGQAVQPTLAAAPVQAEALPEPAPITPSGPTVFPHAVAPEQPDPIEEPEFMLDPDKQVPNPLYYKSGAPQYRVDITFADPTRALTGSFGPFQDRSLAEQCLVAVSARTDVASASLVEV
jgi:hypothetical protein